MKAQKLSDAQFVALLWAVRHGSGVLVRWPGGFWTIKGMPKRDQPRYAHATGSKFSGYDVPDKWHTSTNTVMALESHGFVTRTNEDGYELKYWEAPRLVTDAGRAALEAALAAGQRVKITRDSKPRALHDALRAEAEWAADRAYELESLRKCRWCQGDYGDPSSRYCGSCGVLPACGLSIPAHDQACVGLSAHGDGYSG